jgi:hypothetical protein
MLIYISTRLKDMVCVYIMASPQLLKIDNGPQLYYKMSDLFDYNPEFFFGCTVKKRKIIEKKKIPKTDYIYVNYVVKTKEWNISDESCKKAQLLITKEWVDNHYFTMVRPVFIEETSVITKQNIVVEPTPILESIIEPVIEPVTEPVIENAPPLLELEENEKFKDINGNILEIEVRGQKSRNNIFFKVTDVMKAFKMPNLDIALREKTTNYEKGLHYICFNRVFSQKILLSEDANKKHKTSLYLTYKGLLRVLFNSRTGNAEHFQDWAEDKLFTIQMGEKEQKDVLGAKLLNIELKNIQAVFNKYSQSFPCIYLISLGKVKELRESFEISSTVDDSLTVYKYGFTGDLSRRLGEHNRDYSKYPNVKVELELFNYIDPKYTSDAENDIRDIFESYDKTLDVPGRKELVALNVSQFTRIKKEYSRTGREFAGSSEELQKEISKLKDEIKDLNHKISQQQLTFQLELQKEKSEKERYKKDFEHLQEMTALKEEKYTLQIQLLSSTSKNLL